MATVYWDVETYSQISLTDRGAYIYAADPATGDILLLLRHRRRRSAGVETRRSGAGAVRQSYRIQVRQPITWNSNMPSTRASWSRRYGFPTLPIEQQDCAQRLALANAYPAELGLRCEALGLPYSQEPGGAEGDAASVPAADRKEA